jgi:hypothetical protein
LLREINSAHEAKRVEQFEAHLVRRRSCLLGKSNREYPSHRWPHEPSILIIVASRYAGSTLEQAI